jgi:short-subunit dehydrogenase
MGERVLITGCSTGIGRALAEELTRRGHGVIATARRIETLDGLDVAQKLVLDVADDASVAAAVAATGQVDVLVNNAGFSIWGAAEAPSIADVQRLYDTNVFGPLRMLKAVGKGMRERGHGMIFQISSAAAKRSTALLGHYSSSKAALECYSEAMRIELATFGVAVSIVVLGPVESNFGENRGSVELPEFAELAERFAGRIASNRKSPATSEQVAARIADAIDAGNPPLRIDGSGDGFALVAQRTSVDDETWERDTLAGLFPEKYNVA